MSPLCTLLSPALPSEFLSYVLDHHAHPTTLIICSSRSDFLSSLVNDVVVGHDPPPSQGSDEPGDTSSQLEQQARSDDDQVKHRLLRSPIHQVAISRHMRTIYIPTATHLRAYLSVFSAENSKVVVAPPARFAAGQHTRPPPHLLLYGFLDLHRATSEWSAQGLGSSASALVDLGRRLSWDITVVEPPRGKEGRGRQLEQVLEEAVPVLSGGGRKFGLDSVDGGWSGRTVEVGRVLMRWFRFQRGGWDKRDQDTATVENQDTAMVDAPVVAS